MSAQPFALRELTRAWRELKQYSLPQQTSERGNPQKLLLFYAVECGLKAILLRRENRDYFNSEDIRRTGHDLRAILKDLRVGIRLTLPESVKLKPIENKSSGVNISRIGSFSLIHQAWRYGGQCADPTDKACEEHLEKILEWIEGELK